MVIRYLKRTYLIENPFFKTWTLLYGAHSWPRVVLGSLGSVNKLFSWEIVAPFGETSQPHLENSGIRNCLRGVRKKERKKGRLIAGQHLTVASSCPLHPPPPSSSPTPSLIRQNCDCHINCSRLDFLTMKWIQLDSWESIWGRGCSGFQDHLNVALENRSVDK